MTDVDAEQRLLEVSTAIVARVREALPRYLRGEITRILDAWGRLDEVERGRTESGAHFVSAAATERVVADLEAMFALPAARQSRTPLQIVRTSCVEPTALLEAAGIPPVERDAFAEREWPADRYGIVPPAGDALGDEQLGPLLLAWGLAKTAVLRAG